MRGHPEGDCDCEGNVFDVCGAAEVLAKMWTVTDFATTTTAALTLMHAISRQFQPLNVIIALVQQERTRLWVWSWRLTKMDSRGG